MSLLLLPPLLVTLLAANGANGQVFFKGECPDPPTVVDFKLWLVSPSAGGADWTSSKLKFCVGEVQSRRGHLPVREVCHGAQNNGQIYIPAL